MWIYFPSFFPSSCLKDSNRSKERSRIFTFHSLVDWNKCFHTSLLSFSVFKMEMMTPGSAALLSTGISPCKLVLFHFLSFFHLQLFDDFCIRLHAYQNAQSALARPRLLPDRLHIYAKVQSNPLLSLGMKWNCRVIPLP